MPSGQDEGAELGCHCSPGLGTHKPISESRTRSSSWILCSSDLLHQPGLVLNSYLVQKLTVNKLQHSLSRLLCWGHRTLVGGLRLQRRGHSKEEAGRMTAPFIHWQIVWKPGSGPGALQLRKPQEQGHLSFLVMRGIFFMSPEGHSEDPVAFLVCSLNPTCIGAVNG